MSIRLTLRPAAAVGALTGTSSICRNPSRSIKFTVDDLLALRPEEVLVSGGGGNAEVAKLAVFQEESAC
ncbi:hypothetical protein GCM10028775_22580 [Catellatospora paridis]